MLQNDRNFTRSGAFGNNGTISLDDETNFSTTGAYTQTATGTFETDIAGTVAGTSFGRLHRRHRDPERHPRRRRERLSAADRRVIDVLTADTRSGTFSVIGNGFKVNYLADRVRITPPEPR